MEIESLRGAGEVGFRDMAAFSPKNNRGQTTVYRGQTTVFLD